MFGRVVLLFVWWLCSCFLPRWSVRCRIAWVGEFRFCCVTVEGYISINMFLLVWLVDHVLVWGDVVFS